MTTEQILEKHRQDFPLVEGEDSEHRARYYFLRGWLPEVFAEKKTTTYNMGLLTTIQINTSCPASPLKEPGFRVEDGMLYLNGSLIGEIIEGTVVDGLPFRFRHISGNKYLNGKIQEAQWMKPALAEQAQK